MGIYQKKYEIVGMSYEGVLTAPERILKPSVKSKPLAVKKVCLAFSPDRTMTVF